MSSDITLYGSDGNPVILTGDEMKVHGIQSGSNAEGSWTKFPDGTMICNVKSLFSFVNIDLVSNTVDLPQSYIDSEYSVFISLLNISGQHLITNINYRQTSSVSVTAVTQTLDSITQDTEILITTIGRWK